ncbi:MAG TPA: DUF1697 domain-containing protein [Candidatus Saccharimonadales bacterium]|nr:DUF1697 domain-containing protein [Candidatus Saccharimonadales bacterium]
MTKYALFLRGINVGGRTVRMADLKTCLDKAGLENVVTLMQSGNVVFESEKDTTALKQLIEGTLKATFGYPAKVQVLAMDQLADIVERYPFGAAGDSQHDYVIFMENGLEKELAQESYESAPGEKLAAGQNVVYWRVDKGSTLKSNFAKLLTKAKYKDFNTNRNLKTLRKLLAL